MDFTPMSERNRDAVLREQSRFKTRARLADLVAAQVSWARPEVLVTGFWRSGTTWLQEVLAEGLHAKTVFEPLSPQIARYRTLIRSRKLNSVAAEHGYIPRIGRQEDGRVPWAYLDEAFRGYSAGNAGLICRKSFSESLRRRVVVKDVRMQFSLGDLQKRYQVPIIHLRRNPLAVAASLLKARWDWSFSDVRLRELLEPHDWQLEEFIAPEAVEQCLRLHDTDPVSRIAAYWALTEAAAERQLAGCRHAVLVHYEALVHDPAARVRELCANMSLDLRSSFQWQRASPVTGPDRTSIDAPDRNDGWRNVLDQNDATRLLGIVEAVRAAARVEGAVRVFQPMAAGE